MKIVYSEKQKLHAIKTEMSHGKVQPCFEKPQRADMILKRIEQVDLGEIVTPTDFGLAPLEKIHPKIYLNFLRDFWGKWIQSGGNPEQATPFCFPARSLRQHLPVPASIDAQLGFFSFDTAASLVPGSWEAIYWAAQCALSAQKIIQEGERSAFALCRPPGHHAAQSVMGGYCYINNAAVAAQAFIDAGKKRVAVLDVDYHHGNGTQSIFYEREDVLFTSIHGDPAHEYPFFAGYQDEIGADKGEGWNFNCPLPLHSTDWFVYQQALERCFNKIEQHQSEALVVSLGLDTFEKDPISFFKLKSTDYLSMGKTIASLQLPTLFVFEGGYAVEDLGINCVNVLQGFEAAS